MEQARIDELLNNLNKIGADDASNEEESGYASGEGAPSTEKSDIPEAKTAEVERNQPTEKTPSEANTQLSTAKLSEAYPDTNPGEVVKELMDADVMEKHNSIITAAAFAHEANRAYCQSIGDDSQLSWNECPQWQRDSAINGVEQILTDPHTTPQQSHMSWCQQKVDDGWVYGDTKDPEAKTHPCLVGYDSLPAEQRIKDIIFGSVVRAALRLSGRMI